tara:strand:- start:8480 stop:8788 length:309 start_codon:yes stop_codon:yes gene_type:complete
MAKGHNRKENKQMIKKTILLAAIASTLSGCLESEDSCIDSIISDMERTESIIPDLTMSDASEKLEMRMQILSMKTAVRAMGRDEHRDACDYYWQNSSRLALK